MSCSTAQNVRQRVAPGLYQYADLPSEKHIRYLVLEAGRGTAPLVCSLHVSLLAATPYFEAISYVWGSAADKPFVITCDSYEISIARNLRQVLLQVRSPTTPRSLWVDAICINQGDVAERGRQVALMGELYTRADRVLVCLGMDPDYLEEAESLAGLLSASDRMILGALDEVDCDWDTFPKAAPDNPLLGDERWAAMRALLDQPWFERGWVVQEVWMNDDVRVLWGGHDFAWLAVMRAYAWINARAVEIYARHALTLLVIHTTQYILRHPAEAMPLSNHQPSLYFPGMMDVARGLQLTDPRDRIYAFMSLAGPGEMPPTLRPDYTKPHLEVYREFASGYLAVRQDLGLLSLVDHDHSTLSEDYPTWVPRWDTRVTLENISHVPQSLPGDVLATVNNRMLSVRGTVLGSVELASADIHWVMSGTSDIVRILGELVDSGIPMPYGDMPAILVFVVTLVAGHRPRGRSTWAADRAAYILRLLEAGLPGLDGGQRSRFERDGNGGDPAVFHSYVRAWGHTRRIIQTNRGHIGLAPGAVAKGDLICAVAGANVLMVLRRKNDGTCKLVGPTFVSGVQKTEGGDPLRLDAERTPEWLQWGVEEEISIS